MAEKTVLVKSGSWKTLETFWNVTSSAFFKAPVGAKIKVLYGGGWFSFNRQQQTLDGQHIKKLSVGTGSLVVARMQIRTLQDANVSYVVMPGDVSVSSPEIPF